MDTPSEIPHQEIGLLTEKFSRLAKDLSIAAKDLTERAIIPSGDLVRDLQTVSQEFTELRSKILRVAVDLGVDCPPEEAIRSLTDLNSLCSSIQETESKRAAAAETKRHALSILRSIESLAHRDGIEFSPLNDCKAEARNLYEKISRSLGEDPDSEASALVERSHPIAQLLTWVERQDELADEQWAKFQEVVEKAFGKHLSIAVARRKLVLQASNQEPINVITKQIQDSSDHSDRTSRMESEQSSEVMEASDGTAPTQLTPRQSVSPFLHQKDEDQPQITKIPIAKETDTRRVVPPDRQVAIPAIAPRISEGTPSLPLSLPDSSQALATTLLEGQDVDRHALLSQLMWSLIRGEKLGLAYRIALHIEIECPSIQIHLPSYLLRTIALAKYLRHPDGEISRTLRNDFAFFKDDIFVPSEFTWNCAVRFFLASATLRPALLAPETGASSILRSLRMKEGLSQLFEYCQLIADYADRLHPLDPVALKKVKDHAMWCHFSQS